MIQNIAYPFTKVSDVPPSFIAIKFFASLMRTCSSPPPSSDSSVFPVEMTDTFNNAHQSALSAARAAEFHLSLSELQAVWV